MNTFEKDYQDIISKLGSLKSVSPSGEFTNRVQKLLIPLLVPGRSIWFPFWGRLGLASIFLLVGGSGLVYAAQGSNPGDILYPVKIASEKARLTVATSNTAKIMLHLTNADRRVEEMKATIGRNDAQTINGLSANYSANIKSAVKELEKINGDDDKIRHTVNTHLEDDAGELEDIKKQAPAASQQTIQKTIDTVREDHDGTVKSVSVTPVAEPKKESEHKTEIKSQENSDIKGVSDTAKKTENDFSKDFQEKGGD